MHLHSSLSKSGTGTRGAGTVLPLTGGPRGLGPLAADAKKRVPVDVCQSGLRKAVAAYSPTWWGSTIGASELNFSVRYGKRWILTAITTAVFYLREIREGQVSQLERSRAISTGQLNTLLCLHFLPINVVVSHDP